MNGFLSALFYKENLNVELEFNFDDIIAKDHYFNALGVLTTIIKVKSKIKDMDQLVH